MTATILSETALPDLPSASALEIIGPVAYVIGDDSPFMYLLDATTLEARTRVALFDTAEFGTGRIPKSSKPDLEALVALTWPDGRAGVLALGSGSTPTREAGWFVPVDGGAAVKVSLAGLHTQLRGLLPPGETLNLEAAATSDAELLLFQRATRQGEQVGSSLVFALPLAATLLLLTGQTTVVPAPRGLRFELPDLGGCPAGFSGATFVDGQLFVSASVENTADAVLDGAVLGSFVGVVDLAAQTARFALLAWADGRALPGQGGRAGRAADPGPGPLAAAARNRRRCRGQHRRSS
jgi:hypothetical protein